MSSEPRPAEPVLSGPFEVRALAMGRGQFPGSMLRWASGYDRRDELCFQAVLIRGRGRVVLVNTGFDRDLTDLNAEFSSSFGTVIERAEDEWIHRALARFDVAAADVTDLILTPLGVYSSARLQDFPAAEIWLAREGWLSFHTSHGHPHDGRDSTLSADALAYLTGLAWPRVHLVEAPTEVAPGLRLRWVGGHHRATMTVEVDAHNGAIAISDVFFHRANLTDHHPIGMSENVYEVLAEYQRVRDAGMIPLPLLDPGNFERHPDGLVCRRAERGSPVGAAAAHREALED